MNFANFERHIDRITPTFLLMLGKGLFVAILAPLAVLASAWFSTHWIARRLGGYTGDTLGAVQQKAEVVFLVVAALFIAS